MQHIFNDDAGAYAQVNLPDAGHYLTYEDAGEGPTIAEMVIEDRR